MEDDEERDVALPATLRFVTIFGICLVVGWLLMYLLLRTRAL